jgi:DNA adenine methylase
MFSYIGGKKNQAKWIADFFPAGIKTYAEPFGGAHWVYFASSINANTNVYNDFNRYLVNIFYCAKYHREKFLKVLKSYKEQSKELFDQFKSELTPLTYKIKLGDVETAAKYIYIETQMFSGSTVEKASFVDLKGKYTSKYSAFINKLENPKFILKLHNLTNIENLSYEKIIEKYDSKNTLFYCDPPYYKMEFYYQKEFGRDQHLHLADMLKSIKGKFLLSYYDFPELEQWFPKDKYNWQIKEFNKTNANGRNTTGKGVEILILNY